MTIVLFVLIFGVIVIGHELGHFLLAKVNGITVVEFSVGMGPKLLHFNKGGTEYSLRLFPIGGACMFEGEDGLDTDKGTPSEGAFPNASVWARISTVFAGPFFNFILAYILAMIVVGYTGSDRPVLNGLIDGYMKRAIASFRKICKYDLSTTGDDIIREFDVDIPDEDLDEIADIVSEGMLVQWMKPYTYKQESLESVLNTKDFTTYSPAELLMRIGNAYAAARKDFTNMMREYSYNHGDLTDLHL